jgi:Flp pilus assembly protein TadD
VEGAQREAYSTGPYSPRTATQGELRMAETSALSEFKEGIGFLKNGYANSALPHLRRAVESERHNPYYLSFLGLSIARAEKKWDQAVKLCESALQMKRNEIQLYLNLAEVYMACGRRVSAVDTLDRALEMFGREPRLVKARDRVEVRRSPIVPFLRRQHFVNIGLGKLRHRALGMFQRQQFA